ncbi:MAG: hypothetical protein ABJG41_13120 [Cyclobacteriaceae bacterium]
MKILWITYVLLTLSGKDWTDKKTHEDTLDVSKMQNLTVVVDNIFGDIKVSEGNAATVAYTVQQTISAKNQKDLEKGVGEVKFNVLRRNDSIIFYLTAPFICDKWSGCHKNGRWISREGSNYDFSFDYMLELPANANINVSTIDAERLEISGVTGAISASNVNGDVSIKGAKSIAKATTINGDVDVWFQTVPESDGEYSTINGTISLYCAPAFNATVNARSWQGKLYSAFNYRHLQPQMQKTVSHDGNSTVYKLEESCGIEIGQNGPMLSFETLNGDIYLKKL